MKIIYPKLPVRFKNKWVKALRSGDYKQGCGELCDFDSYIKENRYCCLGVAGKIVGHTDKNLKKFTILENNKKWKVPKQLIGEQSNGNLLVGKLVDMNDGSHFLKRKALSFKQIANWIEKNL
jgi:hypothetical protein